MSFLSNLMNQLAIYSINDVYKLDNLPKMAAYISDHHIEYYSTINGDFLSPSLLSSFDSGKSMISTLANIPISYASLGNHEFDIDHTELIDRIDEFRSFGGNWLNTNIHNIDNLPVGTLITEKAGIRIGWFALCTTMTPNVSTPANHIVFEDELDAAANAVHLLKPHVDIVIALTHQTIAKDKKLAKEIPGIDIILGGHEHFVFYEYYRSTMIVKSGMDAEYMSKILVEKEKGRINISTTLVDLKGYRDDINLKNHVDMFNAKLQQFDRFSITTFDSQLSAKQSRNKECSFCQHVCDILKIEYGADIALVNGGTFRSNKDYLSFTYKDLLEQFPFENNLICIDLKGESIVTALKYSFNQAEGYGGFLQHDSQSGLSTINRQPIDPQKLYKVVTIGLLLQGMDNNPIFSNAGLHITNLDELIHEGQHLQIVLLRHWMRTRWENFTQFDDENKDGKMDREEIRGALQEQCDKTANNLEVDIMLQMADVDNDGTISIDEFVRIDKI